MSEVSRDTATAPRTRLLGELGGVPMLARGSLRVLNPLRDEGLIDGGVHCPFLSVESGFSTAIRVN
jgi:hypothetical protein